jgi:L-glyceraldehyde 3-phosphate reductase
MAKVQKLNEIAKAHGLTMAQLAINWTLRRPEVTSALIGASKPQQITEIVQGTMKLEFSKDELLEIESVLSNQS